MLPAFFKAPKKVIQDITKTQQSFRWSGIKGNKKVSGVSWVKVYKSKVEDGLGVKNIELFRRDGCKYEEGHSICLENKSAIQNPIIKMDNVASEAFHAFRTF